jgi:hypothetical protein
LKLLGDYMDDIEKKEPKDIVMTIRIQPDGQMGIDAPGDGKTYNLPICLWMLELAKDHIKYSNKIALQNKLVKPNMMNRARGAFGGH